MQLNPEQKEQIRHAKERCERRVYMQLTPEQKKEYREAVALEMAGKEANIAHARRIKAAAEQPGFLGDVRRAILLSRPSIPDLATAIGVDRHEVYRIFKQAKRNCLPPHSTDSSKHSACG